MAQKTISVNASASLTANGTSRATGSITWTVPAMPDGVTNWDSIVVSGTWSWSGKGLINSVIINGTTTMLGVPFSVTITGGSPLTITCTGNKNATGNSFSWTDLKVEYTYTDTSAPSETLMIVSGGQLVPVTKVFVVTGGQLVEQTDIKSIFSTTKNYVRGR